MSFCVRLLLDSETAVEYLERLQAQLWETGDHSRDDDIASIMCMLDSPLFKQLLNLQVTMAFCSLLAFSKNSPLVGSCFLTSLQSSMTMC